MQDEKKSTESVKTQSLKPSPTLPQELLAEIFLSSDVDDLWSCRAVDKSWCRAAWQWSGYRSLVLADLSASRQLFRAIEMKLPEEVNEGDAYHRADGKWPNSRTVRVIHAYPHLAPFVRHISFDMMFAQPAFDLWDHACRTGASEEVKHFIMRSAWGEMQLFTSVKTFQLTLWQHFNFNHQYDFMDAFVQYAKGLHPIWQRIRELDVMVSYTDDACFELLKVILERTRKLSSLDLDMLQHQWLEEHLYNHLDLSKLRTLKMHVLDVYDNELPKALTERDNWLDHYENLTSLKIHLDSYYNFILPDQQEALEYILLPAKFPSLQDLELNFQCRDCGFLWPFLAAAAPQLKTITFNLEYQGPKNQHDSHWPVGPAEFKLPSALPVLSRLETVNMRCSINSIPLLWSEAMSITPNVQQLNVELCDSLDSHGHDLLNVIFDCQRSPQLQYLSITLPYTIGPGPVAVILRAINKPLHLRLLFAGRYQGDRACESCKGFPSGVQATDDSESDSDGGSEHFEAFTTECENVINALRKTRSPAKCTIAIGHHPLLPPSPSCDRCEWLESRGLRSALVKRINEVHASRLL